MKKYIRAMLDDLRRKTPSKRSRTTKITPPPEGLDNQVLSSDPLQRTRQLDHQAQKSQERQTLS